jgi:hypothetical protein
MSPPAIRPCISESLNIPQHLAPQLVLDLERVEVGGKVEHSLRRERTDFREGVDVEFREDPEDGRGAKTEERG